MRRVFNTPRFLQKIGAKSLLTLGGLGIVTVLIVTGTASATPPLGFIVNQILASGVAAGGISQHMQISRNPNGTVTPWQLQLQAQGDTDYYSQHLVLSPGGYSGWHSHPGLLVGVVKSGQIDFYDENCQKQTVMAGEVYTENDEVHAIANTGTIDADLYISYLIKHGASRRREESAPPCAGDTGIP
jgi:quercetin dioxygenase-like cupin family protein